MKKHLRRVGSILMLAGVIGWVVLSYLPAGAVTLPQIRFPARWTEGSFTALTVGGFVLFLTLQAWIVQSTAASIRRYRTEAGASGRFNLDTGVETFLTALPIVLMALLAFVSVAALS